MSQVEEKKYKSPALDKGLDILELLSLERVPMAMSEMAKRLDRTRSEIFRMTLTLEQRGYIYQEEGSDKYILTIKLFEMGMNHPPNRSLQEIALPIMNQLSQVSQQACYISVALYEHTVVIANIDAPGHFGYSVRIGNQEHLVNSASGKLVYAFLPPKLQKEWLERFEMTEDAPFSAPKFDSAAKQIKRDGFVQQPNNSVGGITDIAVPIFDAINDYALASLVIPFVQHIGIENELKQVKHELTKAANLISEKLKL